MMAFRELVDNLRFNVFNVNPKYSRIHCDFIKVGGVGHLFIIVNILKKKKGKTLEMLWCEGLTCCSDTTRSYLAPN